MFHPRHVGPVPLPVCKSVLLASPGNDANTVLPVLSIQERTKWPPEFRGKQHKWDSENYTTFSSIWIMLFQVLSSTCIKVFCTLFSELRITEKMLWTLPDILMRFWVFDWITGSRIFRIKFIQHAPCWFLVTETCLPTTELHGCQERTANPWIQIEIVSVAMASLAQPVKRNLQTSERKKYSAVLKSCNPRLFGDWEKHVFQQNRINKLHIWAKLYFYVWRKHESWFRSEPLDEILLLWIA